MSYKRITRSGTLCHVVVRFVNREHRVVTQTERTEYLRRLGCSLRNADWLALSYSLMSTHLHFGMVVGTVPFGEVFRPVHSAFVPWLNRRQGRMGPLLARRPDTYELKPETVGRLLAYQHNNPVRAGVVPAAIDSTWTSHRAYLGLDPTPDWLHVDLGLRLAGFESAPAGCAAFGDFVARQLDCRDDLVELDPLAMREHRRTLREMMSTAIRLGYPQLDSEQQKVTYPILSAEGVPEVAHPMGARAAVDAVCHTTGLSMAVMRSDSRMRTVTAARRLAVLVANDHLGCKRREIAAWLRITPEGARYLARTADVETREKASAIAASVIVKDSSK